MATKRTTQSAKSSAKGAAKPKASKGAAKATPERRGLPATIPTTKAASPNPPAKPTAAAKTRRTKSGSAAARRESGLPGGGQGRVDEVGRTGVYPASGPYPAGDAEIRTPADFVRGQTDAEGRPVEGGSEPIYFGGKTLLGGATPPASGPATTRKAKAPAKPRATQRGTEAKSSASTRRTGKKPS